MVLRALHFARNSHRLCNAQSPRPTARAVTSAHGQRSLLTRLLHGPLCRSSSDHMCASNAGRVPSAHRSATNGVGAAMTGGAPQDLAPCIAAIHGAPTQAVVWATGGGFQVRLTSACAPPPWPGIRLCEALECHVYAMRMPRPPNCLLCAPDVNSSSTFGCGCGPCCEKDMAEFGTQQRQQRRRPFRGC